MVAVLKNWKMLGLAAMLLLFAACSTPDSAPQGAHPPPDSLSSMFISTNLLIAPPLEIVVTNEETPVAAPAPTPAPAPIPASNAPVVLVQTNPPPQPPVVTAIPPPKPAPVKINHSVKPKWLPCEEWSQSRGWGKPQRVRNTHTWTFELRGTNGVLEFTAGNRTALWNGLNLDLGFGPRLTNGQPYFHSLDITKTFEPLSLQPPALRRTNRVVVIDPGHGGENLGAKSVLCDRHEKEFALDWAIRLAPLLRSNGWTVYLTRTNDVEIPLPERVAFGDAMQVDLFISLHFNSTDQPQGQSEQGGLEAYCLTPVGMVSSLTRSYDDDPNALYPNNAFDSENYFWATRLQRALVQGTQRKDRGVRRARFMGVLRGQNRPAVLLEGGYLTYAPEARLINTPGYRQKLAEAVAKALSE